MSLLFASLNIMYCEISNFSPISRLEYLSSFPASNLYAFLYREIQQNSRLHKLMSWHLFYPSDRMIFTALSQPQTKPLRSVPIVVYKEPSTNTLHILGIWIIAKVFGLLYNYKTPLS